MLYEIGYVIIILVSGDEALWNGNSFWLLSQKAERNKCIETNRKIWCWSVNSIVEAEETAASEGSDELVKNGGCLRGPKNYG